MCSIGVPSENIRDWHAIGNLETGLRAQDYMVLQINSDDIAQRQPDFCVWPTMLKLCFKNLPQRQLSFRRDTNYPRARGAQYPGFPDKQIQ